MDGVDETQPGPRTFRTTRTSPVFRAKLRAPAARHLIRRPRLLELIDRSIREGLVVLAAPAGSGKTSLLASWAAETDIPVAWLTLDDSDRNPVQLWTGILAAVETVAPGSTTGALAALTQGAPLDTVVAELLVALESASNTDAVLVIDDVHIVDQDLDVVMSIAEFAQYLPERFHLVLTARRSLALPVDRLRARGRLVTLSFDELRFSIAEASEMLGSLAPDLADADIAERAGRSAGWAANIQLSALAARAAQARMGVPLVEHSDQLTEDYLWHEVLAEESPAVLAVLHAASLVGRVNGDLAAAMTGREDAAALLEVASNRGLFLMRLSTHGWYALHALVRDLVQRELGVRSTAGLGRMHVGAARWYQDAGEPLFAVLHWLKADQPREALRAIAANNGDLYDRGLESVVIEAIAQIPHEVIATDLSAAMDYAWSHVLVDRRVLVGTVDRVTSMASGQDLDTRTRGQILLLEAVAATSRGAWEDVRDLATAALDALGLESQQDTLGRFGWNMVARGQALTERWSDDLGTSRRAAVMLEVDLGRRLALQGTKALGLALEGRPTTALSVAQDTVEGAEQANLSILSLELGLALAIAHRELGQRDLALSELTVLAQHPMTPLPYVPFRAGLELAELHLAAGRLDEAETRLAAAKELMSADFEGLSALVWAQTTETLIAIAAGEMGRAAVAASRIVHPVWGPISLARLRLGDQDLPAAAAALATVRPWSVRQQVVVDLLRSRAASAPPEALESVRRAATLASANGLVQTVAFECAPGTGVLERLERAADSVPSGWLDRVRRGTAIWQTQDAFLPEGVQTLTPRERDILRMLPSRLTVTEIADELHLSRNTVKFHLKVIYRKLECGSRADAADIARRMTRIRMPGPNL